MTENTDSSLLVSMADGAVTLTLSDKGVLIRLPCDAVLVSWSDWEFVARMYGKKKS